MDDVKKLILIIEFFIFYSRKNENKTNNNNKSFTNDWLNNFLALKNEYEDFETKINEEEGIMLFLIEKPKIDIVSIKTFLLSDNN